MMWRSVSRNALLLALTASSATAFSGVLAKRSSAAASSLTSGISQRLYASAAATASADTPVTLPDFASRQEYMDYMKSVASLPAGFAVGTAEGTFVSEEAPAMGDLPIRGTVIHLTAGATDNWAAVFTKNKFPGAPVIVGRSRLANGGPLHAIVINNKVSNVCSGGDGVADSEHVCQAVADALDLPGGASTVLPSSTGVIGWRLPAKELASDVVPKAVDQLASDSALSAAEYICTTDRYPKVRSLTLSNGARLVGIAKGAGMIEPNMATMLCYIMTDAAVDKSDLQSMLDDAVEKSFNSISVDGAESTSDTVVLMASNQVQDAVDKDEFQQALLQVCQGLASDIVRNGEGTGHVMRLSIKNFPGTDVEARNLGRHVVNSALFKCAVAGNDPNTGRLAGAIGSFMGRFPTDEAVDQMTLELGGRVIMANGKFVLEGDAVEKELSGHLENAQYPDASDYPPHQKFVEIGVDFGEGQGSGSALVIGSDLTAEYVAVNADYRS